MLRSRLSHDRLPVALAAAIVGFVASANSAAATPAGSLRPTAAIDVIAGETSEPGAAVRRPPVELVHYRGRGRIYVYPRYRPYFYAAPPVYVGPGECGWLRARWHATGSHYWYRRWRACIG